MQGDDWLEKRTAGDPARSACGKPVRVELIPRSRRGEAAADEGVRAPDRGRPRPQRVRQFRGQRIKPASPTEPSLLRTGSSALRLQNRLGIHLAGRPYRKIK